MAGEGESGPLRSSRYLMSRNSTMNNNQLLSRDEQEMLEARSEFYKNVGSEKDLLKTGEWIGKKGIPIFVAIFCILYDCFLTLYSDQIKCKNVDLFMTMMIKLAGGPSLYERVVCVSFQYAKTLL